MPPTSPNTRQTSLDVQLTATIDGRPLVTLVNPPGPDADLSPAQARAYAAALWQAASESEMRSTDKPQKRSYRLGRTCSKCNGKGALPDAAQASFFIEHGSLSGAARTKTLCPKCGGAGRLYPATGITRLLEAAKEIDRLAQKQKAKAVAWSKLAADAKDKSIPRVEIERRRRELEAPMVIDFGTAIEELQVALEEVTKE